MTTWATFDTDSLNGQYTTNKLTFSNGNLTAVSNYTPSGSAVPFAQTNDGKRAGKWMVQFILNASGNLTNEYVGLVSSTGSRGGNLGGQKMLGYQSNGSVYVNNSLVTTLAPWGVVAKSITMLLDLDNHTCQFAVDAGAPSATIDISLVLGVANPVLSLVYPAANFFSNTTSFTINCGQSAFPISTPSGFTPGWSDVTTGTGFGSFATNGYGQGETASGPANNVTASPYVSGVTGAVTSISMDYAGAAVTDVVVAMWADAGGAAGALLGVSSQFSNTGIGFKTASISGVSVVAGTKYWIGPYTDVGGTSQNSTWPPGGPSAGLYYVAAGTTWPAPPSTFPASPTAINYRYALFVSVGTSHRRPMSVRFMA